MPKVYYRGTPHFEEAVMRMAKSPKSIQQRLADALHDVSSCRIKGSLPDAVMKEFDEVWAKATAVNPAAVDIAGNLREAGSIAATCATMDDEEAVEIASVIVGIYERLRDDH